MAKDGTFRGGIRVRSGKKPTKKSKKELLNFGIVQADKLPSPEEIKAEDIPEPASYLKSKQKNGKEFKAEEIYKQTYVWLKQRGCEKLVSKQLIEQYAMAVARYIQVEEAISEFGFLAKHPTTGNAMQSPFVTIEQAYMKQINATWYQIYVIIKDSGVTNTDELDEQDKMMARLLNS